MNRFGSFFGGCFVVLLLVGIGALFAGFGVVQLIEYVQSSEWPAAEGNITHLSIDQDYDSDSGYTYRANIEYTYSVNGVDYHGNRYQFGADIWSSDRGRAERMIDAYETGEDVLVYYNPSNPSSSVLLREFDWLLLLFAGIGAVLVLVGLGIGFGAIAGGLQGMGKAKEQEELQSGDYLLENEKFKL